MIIGGRTHSLSPDDYVYGALALYLDIINLITCVPLTRAGGVETMPKLQSSLVVDRFCIATLFSACFPNFLALRQVCAILPRMWLRFVHTVKAVNWLCRTENSKPVE